MFQFMYITTPRLGFKPIEIIMNKKHPLMEHPVLVAEPLLLDPLLAR